MMQNVVAMTLHGSDVKSVFDLLGQNENDLTSALGFALANCSPLLNALLGRLLGRPRGDQDEAPHIALEKRDRDGRTDLEIQTATALLVCEAKQGWRLPSTQQLGRYVRRIHRRGGGILVTLSQASPALAAANLPSEIDGVPVVHLPWRDVLTDIDDVRPQCRGRERLWLDQLRDYLRGVIRLRSIADSWTYSVVLNRARPPGSELTYLQYVTEQLTYFHPYGVGGWPLEPPNFMAFRWEGAVHRIHRVIDADVVPTLPHRYPNITASKETMRPHAIYKLSAQRLPPLAPIPSGALYRASRLWVLLDQLQTSETLAEARDGTRALTQSG
ncbi:hypothetical protein FHT40_002441 [Mycolicibacterium sp. BK556]|uniref:hypothetical protein n=1 Tax=unclassified Mycolicibacterium TaxID=2636767 RepID=UPI001825506E|nr:MULTISPECIES: hypothetical protein [unclassified Mycolicibacterium]MBB3602780.1 hypothetical protein [Mycolicibacterium sp. BK556]MBB3632975.1 hypothetical protein [Mycolicibacterium sp. BK607]